MLSVRDCVEGCCAGCDCGEDPLCAFREIKALTTSGEHLEAAQSPNRVKTTHDKIYSDPGLAFAFPSARRAHPNRLRWDHFPTSSSNPRADGKSKRGRIRQNRPLFDLLSARGSLWPGRDRKMVPPEAVGCMLSGGWEGKMQVLDQSSIMRSFCSGRRFSCLEVLLALLLSAPISLHCAKRDLPRNRSQHNRRASRRHQRNRNTGHACLAPAVVRF